MVLRYFAVRSVSLQPASVTARTITEAFPHLGAGKELWVITEEDDRDGFTSSRTEKRIIRRDGTAAPIGMAELGPDEVHELTVARKKFREVES